MKIFKFIFLLLIISSEVRGKTIFKDNFENPEKWHFITDQVMGGESSIETIKDGETFHILGNVSTRNNGGFIRFATNAESISAKAEGIKFLAKANNQTYDIHISLSGMKMPPWSFFFTKFYKFSSFKIFIGNTFCKWMMR